MGWLSDAWDWITGEDDEDQKTVVSSSTDIPDYLKTFTEEQIDLIDQLSKKDFEYPSKEAVVDFTPEQQAALTAAQDYYGAEGGTDAYKAAAGALTNLGDLAGQRITDAGALDPFMNQYLDPMRAEIDRSYGEAQIAADASALGAGAFGGNRRGIVEAELRGDAMRQKADLQRQAFDRAVDNYYKDMKERGRLGQVAMMGAGNLQNIKGKDLGAQFTYGGYDQAMEQAKRDAELRREQDARDWAFKMADFRQGAFSNLPYGQTVTRTGTYDEGGGGFLQGLGNIGGVASGIGNFFATPSGGGGSPASGWSNMWNSFWK